MKALASRRHSTISRAVAQVTKKPYKDSVIPALMINGRTPKSGKGNRRKSGSAGGQRSRNEVTPLDFPDTHPAWP